MSVVTAPSAVVPARGALNYRHDPGVETHIGAAVRCDGGVMDATATHPGPLIPSAGRFVGPTSALDDVLRVEHIAKRFGPVTALRDVSIHLREGEVLGLLGDNGAGKSTLIKIICGLYRADAGSMWLKGQPLPQERRRRAGARRRHRLPGSGAGRRAARLRQHVPQAGGGVAADPVPAEAQDAPRGRAVRSMRSGFTFRGSTLSSASSRVASARRSPSPAPSTAMPTSCCSTNRWPRWAPRRAA